MIHKEREDHEDFTFAFFATFVAEALSSTLRISATSASGGQGFGTNQSQPASVARWSSPDSSCAVRATTGIWAVRASLFSLCGLQAIALEDRVDLVRRRLFAHVLS